jgi:hypothetical protein
MGDGKVGVPYNESEERRNSYLQRSFSNHLIFAALHVMSSAPSVVIRPALQISCATLTAALPLCSDPSGSQSEKQRILGLLEVKYYLIRCHEVAPTFFES